MQYTTINDVWTAFDEMCAEAPRWDRDDLQAAIKETFPGKRYEELTPSDVEDLVIQMRHETDELDEGEDCIYCGKGSGTDEVPKLGDDEAWSRLAKLHRPGCEWIKTRAHRL